MPHLSVRAFRIGSGPPEAALEGMTRAHLRPDARDFVFYTSASPIRDNEMADLISAFEIGEPLSSTTRADSIEPVATAIVRTYAETPSIDLYAVRAGWADAVGAALHGVVVVDSATNEALWIYATETWSVE